jgi:hypothetical protein
VPKDCRRSRGFSPISSLDGRIGHSGTANMKKSRGRTRRATVLARRAVPLSRCHADAASSGGRPSFRSSSAEPNACVRSPV